MKGLLPVLLLSLFISSAVALATEPGSPDSFLVMSYNIRFGTADDGPNRWELRREALVHQIAEVSPDLIGLQEALRFQLDYLHEMLPAYGEAGVGRDDGDTLGEYSAIFYRLDRFELDSSATHWFSDTPDLPGSMGWGNRIPRIYTTAWLTDKRTGGSLQHINLHLDHESQESREKSTLEISKLFFMNPDAAIVTGDFNAGADNPAMGYLLHAASDAYTSLPLVDTWQQIHGGNPPGTFSGFTGDSTGTMIDFILISGGQSPDFTILDAEILTNQIDGRWASDHFPVIAWLIAK